MQPGEVVGPGGEAPEVPKEEAEQVQSPAPEAVPADTVTQTQEPTTNWEYKEESFGAESQPSPTIHEPVSWTASEYISHDKNPNWYVLLGLAIVASSIAVYFITGELISSIVIVVMGIAFGGFAARKPQELTYILDNTALHIGPKQYPYALFKSFTVMQEDAIHSISLLPMQRFMPPLSIYFDPADEEKIVNALSSYLPYEDRKQDYVDRFMRKVKF